MATLVSLKTSKMYATCINDKGCRLVKDFEYEIVEVKTLAGFGENCFYVVAGGLMYASCHFSVTYYKF